MKRLKVSQGEFEVRDEVTDFSKGEFAVRDTTIFGHHVGTFNPYEFYGVDYDTSRANANLFCDAINTANKLDKLPSELAADREMLLNAVKAVAWSMPKGDEDRLTMEQIIKKVEG